MVTFSSVVTGLIVVVVVKTGCVMAETPDGETPMLGTPSDVVEDEMPAAEGAADEYAAGAKVQDEDSGAELPPHKDPACAAVEKLSPNITAALCNKYFMSITLLSTGRLDIHPSGLMKRLQANTRLS